MTVYKVFLKILKNNFGLTFMYIAIFLGITMIVTNANESGGVTEFEAEKVNVAIVDNDKSEISKALTTYIKANTVVKKIDTSEAGMADALFYRIVEYIVVIPKGYGEDFLIDGEMELEKREVAGSYSSIYVDNLVNNYMHTIKALQKSFPDKELTEVIEMANKNSETGMNVNMAEGKAKVKNNKMITFYNYSCYGLMGSIIMGMGAVINSFLEKNVKQRNAVSPMSTYSLYGKIIIATCGLVAFIWVFSEIAGIIIVGKDMITIKGAVMAVNMLIMSLVAMAIGFLTSIFIRNKGGRGAAANVITLGMSFISGIFVPLELLGDEIKVAASFVPTYWNVRVNELLGECVEVSSSVLMEAFSYMGIQILFVIAILCVGLVAAKKTLTLY